MERLLLAASAVARSVVGGGTEEDGHAHVEYEKDIVTHLATLGEPWLVGETREIRRHDARARRRRGSVGEV